MTRKDFIKNYWRYYLILEQHVMAAENYVDFSEDNGETYSVGFMNCLNEIGSEVDVCMKAVCGFAENERKTISDYCPIILEKYPIITTQKVIMREMEIIPFENWTTEEASQSLTWWKTYNNVKHGRNLNYKLANLKNVLYALAGLYVLEMFYLKEISHYEIEPDIPDGESKLFMMENWKTKWESGNNTFFQTYE